MVAALLVAAESKPYGPDLADLLQIVGSGGASIGLFIGLLLPTPPTDPGQIWRNALKGFGAGGAVGTLLAWVIWFGLRLNGGVG